MKPVALPALPFRRLPRIGRVPMDTAAPLDTATAIFLAEFEASGLRQRDLARLLDKDKSVVNRWYRVDRRDRQRPPGYAIAFLAAWNLMEPAARRKLLARLEQVEAAVPAALEDADAA